MSDDAIPSLRVGAHVLVQLGSELVTDAEQAILECVKNAYDADSPTCRIEVRTAEIGVRVETGPANRLARFRRSTETVAVQLVGPDGALVPDDVSAEDVDDAPWLLSDAQISRRLSYRGRVTIEDTGDGLTKEQLQSSWLVVSGSAKRVEEGRKAKTKGLKRTPLGDKGLGRLGSMRLGDILLVESATDKSAPLETAQFRWADCTVARTVDEIPVFLQTVPNEERFKGTRVSVLGLRDMDEWKLRRSTDKLRRGLTRLISPFEARATFKVSLSIDGPEHSLAAVTEDVLNKAVAQFTFKWEVEPKTKVLYLVATARFKKRLFTPERSGEGKKKAEFALIPDGGAGFGAFLPKFGRTKNYAPEAQPDGAWYITMTRRFPWTSLIVRGEDSVADPGPFEGAIHYFNLDTLGTESLSREAGQPTDRELIREMAGVTILRDGFQVRSQGDWLGLAEGMTSGSTYGLRASNTVGYFALTGEHNFALVEKSDREGFVENAAFRGFMRVASACRDFANETLEGVRRAFDAYYKELLKESKESRPLTTTQSMAVVEASQGRAQAIRALTETAVQGIAQEISDLENVASTAGPEARRALQLAKNAFQAVETVRERLGGDDGTRVALMRIRHELELNQEQISALFESAAVGMSARGLAHELRTHLDDIVLRTDALEKAVRKTDKESEMMPNLRGIRGACTEIRKAAALIDPMLPRSRTIRQTFSLRDFMGQYVDARASSFKADEIRIQIVDQGAPTIRTNRSRLTQVVDNLVRNSAFWLVKAGQVTGADRERIITIDLRPHGFLVSDSGPGVDPHVEDSLFEIFVTAKTHDEPGQGLGLYIVRNLLQAEGCDIDLLPDRNADGRRFRFGVNLAGIVVGERGS